MAKLYFNRLHLFKGQIVAINCVQVILASNSQLTIATNVVEPI